MCFSCKVSCCTFQFMTCCIEVLYVLHETLVLTHWCLGYVTDVECVIFKCILVVHTLSILSEIALRAMLLDLCHSKAILVQIMAWCHQLTTCYLCQYWPRSISPYVISRVHWVNPLRPSDAIWRQRTGSTLAQVMAWCLTAPSHYLNQCWLIISEVQWNSYKGNFTRDSSIINH